MIPKSAELFGDEFRRRLLDWYAVHGRTFPWRSTQRTMSKKKDVLHDPWMILVSEVMLQQTQASRVVAKLPLFLEQFPSVDELALASRAELLRAWQGMGYNSRALRLQETAREICNDHNGRFPQDFDSLIALPGIGRYTASALLCFAFGHDVPVVDVNIARLLSRIFHKCYTPQQVQPEKDLFELAEHLVPSGDAYRYHQGLMDLGATVCTARSPQCQICVLSSLCLSSQFGDATELFDPVSTRTPEPVFLGEPRRLWRGRIVELLRGESAGLSGNEIVDRMIPITSSGSLNLKQEAEFKRIVEALLRDGLVEQVGVVREGSVMMADVLRLAQG